MTQIYSLQRQRQVFTDLWSTFSQQIQAGKGAVDFPLPVELTPRYITTVIRLPQAYAEDLSNLMQDACPADYHYPAADLHLTIVNLDALLEDSPKDNLTDLGSCISAEIHRLRPLELELKGLGIFPTTIFTQVYDKGGVLEQYREAVERATGTWLGKATTSKRSGAPVPGIAFVNVIRFKQSPSLSAVEFVRQRRDIPLGTWTADQMQLVVTDKLLSAERTLLHASIQLPRD